MYADRDEGGTRRKEEGDRGRERTVLIFFLAVPRHRRNEHQSILCLLVWCSSSNIIWTPSVRAARVCVHLLHLPRRDGVSEGGEVYLASVCIILYRLVDGKLFFPYLKRHSKGDGSNASGSCYIRIKCSAISFEMGRPLVPSLEKVLGRPSCSGSMH